MDNNLLDVVVIGGGAAGLSAALILGRARRRVLVIDAGQPRNRYAEHMHGVLGHDGAEPAALVARGRAEAASYGVTFADGLVERIDETDAGRIAIVTRTGEQEQTRAAIVATGVRDDVPDIPGVRERWGATVLHCPYCHGWEVRDKRFGVLATSPASLHQAELVRQWSSEVVLFTAAIGSVDPETEHRLRARDIELVSAQVIDILGDAPKITGVRTEDGRTIPLDVVFTAPAPQPHDAFLAHLDLERTETATGSFLEVDPTGKTSSERIWAAGNVVNPAANVPMVIGAGAIAGAAVNAALVAAEFDTAVADVAGVSRG